MTECERAYKILIVDDDDNIVTFLQEALRDEGWLIISAKDGEEAIKLFDERAPDQVILDIMLPGISGEEVCRYMRNKSSVPVLVLSARLEQDTKVQCLEMGADDYVTKPFDIQELAARIKAILRRSRFTSFENTKPHFVYHNLSIDFNTRRVIISDKEVLLTPKEYELLKELAMHQGNAITYDELLSAVWGEKYRGEKGYIHNFISRLRAKIEPDLDNPQYIINSPGFGYYFSNSRSPHVTNPTIIIHTDNYPSKYGNPIK